MTENKSVPFFKADMPARYGDIFKVDLLSVIKDSLNGPLAGITAAEIGGFYDIITNGMGRIVTSGNEILSHQLKSGNDAPVIIPGGTGNYTYTTRSVDEKQTADVARTGILYVAPTLDMEALRSGKRMEDGTVSISFTVLARGEEYSYTLKLKLTDFTSAADRVFFGDRDLKNPGYSKFDLNGAVQADSDTNNELDVWRVEQRLKYLGFTAMGYGITGLAGNTKPPQKDSPNNYLREFDVDGKIEEKEKLAIIQFQKVVDGTVDGVVSQTGTSLNWLNAYNAPHWMDIGNQMQYQGGAAHSSYSLPDWNNTQTASTGDSTERYGTSWTRDLMRADQYASDLYNLEHPDAAGSRFNAGVDANHGISLNVHTTHGDGMNFDLGIARSFLTGVFLTNSAVALAAETPINVSLAAQLQPAAGAWSNAYAAALTAQLPNNSRTVGLTTMQNYQRDAMRDFLAIYSVTRDNGAEASGWDDLIAQVASGGTSAQKEKIRTALFGDGTATGSIVSGALVGGNPSLEIKNAFANYRVPDGSLQAALLRMGEVLNALGVPRQQSQIPTANTTYNLNAHFNHFHVYVKPPVRVEIETTSNLLAEQEEMAPMILAAAPTSTATDAGAASAPKVKYDKVFSGCTYVVSANWSPASIKAYNDMDPISSVLLHLADRGILISGITGPGEFNPDQIKVKVLQNPAHGEFLPNSYTYQPSQGYIGIDQTSFEVEVLGKKFKVIFTLVVQNSNPDGPTEEAKAAFDNACPSDKGSSLDIIELPTDGFVSDEELAKLHSMVSFALGSEFSGNGGLLSFADLSGGAVGQAVGNTITLDTNASGYNWFIDTTPSQNEEFLPTSNPNEWVAKAGSAAAGKMDMLSVLLHEYGHALGINHSADPNDYMGTTLTAGVRRLPSAEEMVLMQGLVAEAKASLTPTLSQGERGQTPTPFPTLPLGTSFIGFLGLLRSNRYGGLNIAADPSTLVTQYDWAANATLVNGSLNAADGWSTQGSVNIGNGVAVMNEVSSSQTRLSQVFLLNPTDRFLSFTLSGTALDDLTGAPDDAFEVALLDANSGTSLLGGTGLTRTDSVLNLQADGTQRFADCVTCINNTDGSRTYRVDLAGVPAGVAANLSFDLIGFGGNGSHVTVSDVRLSGLPQLHDDAATMLEDGTLAFNPFAQVDNPVLSGVEGAAILQLGSHVVDQPAHGAVTVNTDGTFVYTPQADYFGTDTFTYRLSDGPLESNLATVSITLTPVNDAPVVADVQAITAEDTALVIALGAYAIDVDSNTLTTQIVTSPAHGVLTQNADGSYTYTPEANYNGADSFTYQANDGDLNSNIATVSLNVTAVNDAPTAGDLNLAAVEDTLLPMNLLAAASDIDGDALTAAIVATAQHGQVAINADGSFTYTPDLNFNGSDSFTFKVDDGANLATGETLNC
jgi:VCBS repeat-containing protein